ncbi:hypothetical protein NIES4103_67720 [Nostoc sp. NIES-4103]|nr:hypothetical protein NIES4103_67720 [Nostoc sp. NIES-4103]
MTGLTQLDYFLRSEIGDYQEINYYYLWGGHLVRPKQGRARRPPHKKNCMFFYLEVPRALGIGFLAEI